ncbi:hypothetical protein ACFFNY_15355 [Paenibacillus hodogayensis]|uniref:Uncharacterized protein n=1 Tax=Paenibacillus hodogayensis TaxID=279208 RepID=A0ABV5VX98_9BACL
MKDHYYQAGPNTNAHAFGRTPPYGAEAGPLNYNGNLPLKSKFLATVFSMFVPGTGQMYVGAVMRGMSIMLLLVMNIVAIVYFVNSPAELNVLPVTLLSLLIPVLYFYNVFDALHQTEAINQAIREGHAYSGPIRYPNADGGNLLLGLIGVIVFVCSLSAFGGWWDGLFTINTAIGGAVLLVGGAFLLFKEFRKKS